MFRTPQLTFLPTDTHSQTRMHSLDTFPFRVFLPISPAFLGYSLRSLLWVQFTTFKKYYNRIYPQQSSYQDLQFPKRFKPLPSPTKKLYFWKAQRYEDSCLLGLGGAASDFPPLKTGAEIQVWEIYHPSTRCCLLLQLSQLPTVPPAPGVLQQNIAYAKPNIFLIVPGMEDLWMRCRYLSVRSGPLSPSQMASSCWLFTWCFLELLWKTIVPCHKVSAFLI